MTPEFQPWPKIARLNRDVVVTEKLDGTNACVIVDESGVYAQSRKKIITPAADNYGFARWVQEHADELSELGPGYHFGEWWGRGIQRGYGLPEKRFSLFNTARWGTGRPDCCHVVPTLYVGPFSQRAFSVCLMDLQRLGSEAASGFMDPEGIVIFHTAAQMMFKVTIKGDEAPKGHV